MENIQSSKRFQQNFEKISLRGYYNGLPERVSPKLQFLEEIQRRCKEESGKQVTMATVRNWVLYGIKPMNPIHVKVISDITNIKEEDLW